MREIGAEIEAQIRAGNDADIDLVIKLGKNLCRERADPVAPRFVNARSYAKIFNNDLRQLDEFLAFRESKGNAQIVRGK